MKEKTKRKSQFHKSNDISAAPPSTSSPTGPVNPPSGP